MMKPGLLMGWTWALAMLLAWATTPGRAADLQDAPRAVDKKVDKKSAQKDLDLFQFSHVWNVHLTISADQWAAMEPKNAGAWPPPPPQRRGPGAPGAPATTQRVNFGPSAFLIPSFMKGDQDKDGKLSKAEFTQLTDNWFGQWDTDKSGRVSREQVRVGLNTTVAAADPNEGRPAGLNLQGGEGKRNGLASAMGVEFEYVRGDIEIEGNVFKDVAVRYKGNGTWLHSRGSLKKSFKVDLNDHVKDQNIAGATKLNFHSNATDASLMNEVMSHRLYRDAGLPAPRTSYARVYLTVPGKHERKYVGVYSIIENVDKEFAKAHFGVKGGAIFKPVTPTPFTDMGDKWENYLQPYDPKTGVSEKEKRRLIEFCKLVSHADDAEFAAKAADYVDIDQFAGYMAVTVWLSTLDSILGVGQNYYVYLHPRTGKLNFIPWDLDHSFGQFFLMGNQAERDNLSIRKPWLRKNRFLERMFQLESFQKAYLAKLEKFSGTIFKPERFAQQVDEIAAAIRPGIVEETGKVEAFDKVVKGESVPPPIPAPMRLMMQGMETRPIKPFAQARTPKVLDQLSGKSQGVTIDEIGFGPRGGGPPGQGFGPGNIVSPAFMTALDGNKDGSIEQAEARNGFAQWFDSWTTGKSGVLSEQQIRAGLDQVLSPRGFGQRGDPGQAPFTPPQAPLNQPNP